MRTVIGTVIVVAIVLVSSGGAAAQTRPTRPAPPASGTIGVRGFATFGSIAFQAKESFEAVLGGRSGPIFGGGAQVLLPSGIYVEVSASRFKRDGERVFVGPGNEIFPLGVPVDVTIVPLEITGGFRYTRRSRTGRVSPVAAYGGLGYSSYRYQETSEFAEPDEDVDDWHSGFHVVGGAEYQLMRWVAIGGELAWSSIADALGQGGVSAAFAENNLGGTTVRVKLSVGR